MNWYVTRRSLKKRSAFLVSLDFLVPKIWRGTWGV